MQQWRRMLCKWKTPSQELATTTGSCSQTHAWCHVQHAASSTAATRARRRPQVRAPSLFMNARATRGVGVREAIAMATPHALPPCRPLLISTGRCDSCGHRAGTGLLEPVHEIAGGRTGAGPADGPRWNMCSGVCHRWRCLGKYATREQGGLQWQRAGLDGRAPARLEHAHALMIQPRRVRLGFHFAPAHPTQEQRSWQLE